VGTIQTSTTDNVAVITLARDKVNAINDRLLNDINTELDRIEACSDVDGIVLTGRGKFFSFGFDVPRLLAMSRDGLTTFLTKYTATLLRLFTFHTPVIAAINGHATAGGCMFIMACDFRVAEAGRAKVGLNEIDLGVSVFRGSAEMLRYWVGNRNAELILNEGTLYSVVEAENLGLIDEIVAAGQLMDTAIAKARRIGNKPKSAYRAIKKLMRGCVVEKIVTLEQAALDSFIETWYSNEAQSILSRLQILK
jgi:enoyl-CoA hydratase/carnithine racemase